MTRDFVHLRVHFLGGLVDAWVIVLWANWINLLLFLLLSWRGLLISWSNIVHG